MKDAREHGSKNYTIMRMGTTRNHQARDIAANPCPHWMSMENWGERYHLRTRGGNTPSHTQMAKMWGVGCQRNLLISMGGRDRRNRHGPNAGAREELRGPLEALRVRLKGWCSEEA